MKWLLQLTNDELFMFFNALLIREHYNNGEYIILDLINNPNSKWTIKNCFPWPTSEFRYWRVLHESINYEE